MTGSTLCQKILHCGDSKIFCRKTSMLAVVVHARVKVKNPQVLPDFRLGYRKILQQTLNAPDQDHQYDTAIFDNFYLYSKY